MISFVAPALAFQAHTNTKPVYGLYRQEQRVLVTFLVVLALDTIIVLVGIIVTLPDKMSRADFVRFSSKALSFFG